MKKTTPTHRLHPAIQSAIESFPYSQLEHVETDFKQSLPTKLGKESTNYNYSESAIFVLCVCCDMTRLILCLQILTERRKKLLKQRKENRFRPMMKFTDSGDHSLLPPSSPSLSPLFLPLLDSQRAKNASKKFSSTSKKEVPMKMKKSKVKKKQLPLHTTGPDLFHIYYASTRISW